MPFLAPEHSGSGLLKIAYELITPDCTCYHHLSSKFFWHTHCGFRATEGDADMETIATSAPVKSSSRSRGIDWPIFTFWLTYFSMILVILYALISDSFYVCLRHVFPPLLPDRHSPPRIT